MSQKLKCHKVAEKCVSNPGFGGILREPCFNPAQHGRKQILNHMTHQTVSVKAVQTPILDKLIDKLFIPH